MIYPLLPHGKDEGALEYVCLESVRNEPTMQCVDEFIECVKKIRNGWTSQAMESKARVHAYLASQDRPDRRLGEAPQKHRDSDAPAFQPLKKLLSEL